MKKHDSPNVFDVKFLTPLIESNTTVIHGPWNFNYFMYKFTLDKPSNFQVSGCWESDIDKRSFLHKRYESYEMKDQ